MFQKTNLYSLYCAYRKVDKDILNSFLKFHNITIKEQELQDLIAFIKTVLELKKATYQSFESFSFGFTIPQIGKEFDLLRFGKRSVLNIELKSAATLDKIKDQLIKNKYYLRFLNLTLYLFTYVSSENKFYELNIDDELIEVDTSRVIQLLNGQLIDKEIDISKSFNPTDFLVSPFNSTEKFIQNEYFLTQEQDEFKKKIIKNITVDKSKFIVLKGQAGSGKTLLIYDLAKHFMQDNCKTAIIHCANLNEGQIKLIDENDWNIVAIKSFDRVIRTHNLELIIIDESQRIRISQLNLIIEHAKSNGIPIIFSYDGKQVLSHNEKRINIPEVIRKNVSPIVYELKAKIRTNKEITAFIKSLFDKSRIIEQYPYESIELLYLDNIKNARDFTRSNVEGDWTLINYTPSLHTTDEYEKYHVAEIGVKTHSIIGQEFDNVIAIIDQDFIYKENSLSYKKNPYYNPEYMLYQNITRARNKVKVIIIDNTEVLSRCLQILNVQKK